MASTPGAMNTLESSNPAGGAQRESRESWRKKKELEEARKAGTAPAEVDEEGRDINPHIPQYISQAPWYVDTGRPTLKHQRPQEEKQKQYNAITDWYKRGETGKAARKFRKGACENCGAMTHSKKDCMDRPRKMGAKLTSKDIKPDEFIQPKLALSYDGKRDRWNGYNPDWHQEVIEEYQKLEDAKRQLKSERLEKELLTGDVTEGKQADSDSDEDEDKYADNVDMPGTKFDNKTRSTVRNLRIREDTAKYLRNLGPDAPYYDPKTHSMRENPYSHMNKSLNELPYAGDNFVRHSGDVKSLAKQQLFAWEASEHGTDIHPNVDPTKLELMYKEFRSKKKNFKNEQQQSILEKYGGEEHLDAPPKEMLLAQTEHYVEYSRTGAVIKGQERAKVKSRYEEDVFINNHTSVWGSYWVSGKWGFACCHSLIKNSFCTGEAGKRAARSGGIIGMSRKKSTGGGDSDADEHRVTSLVEQHKKKLAEMSKEERKSYQKSLAKGSEEELKEDEIQKAMKALAEREREAERLLAMDERKRPYNSMKADFSRMPTEEEMEAFRLKRRREDDPMADFLK